MNYVAGWNMEPYSPDPDNLFVTSTFEEAVSYLKDEVERWWDSDYMMPVCGCDDDAHESDDDTVHPRDIDARYLDAHTDLHNAGITGPSFLTTAYGPNGYPYSFWIDWTDEEVSDE